MCACAATRYRIAKISNYCAVRAARNSKEDMSIRYCCGGTSAGEGEEEDDDIQTIKLIIIQPPLLSAVLLLAFLLAAVVVVVAESEWAGMLAMSVCSSLLNKHTTHTRNISSVELGWLF